MAGTLNAVKMPKFMHGNSSDIQPEFQYSWLLAFHNWSECARYTDGSLLWIEPLPLSYKMCRIVINIFTFLRPTEFRIATNVAMTI